MTTKTALLAATSLAVLGTLLAARPGSRHGPQWLHKAERAGRYAIEERLIGGELRAEVLLNRDTGQLERWVYEVVKCTFVKCGWQICCSLAP